jgi:hypothetical protein
MDLSEPGLICDYMKEIPDPLKPFITASIFACLVLVWISRAQEDPAELPLYIFPDEDASIPLVGWKTHSGDSLEWSNSVYSDSAWSLTRGAGLWLMEGFAPRDIRWFRKHIFIPENLDSLQPLVVYQVAAVSASEIYWDGHLILQNGVVGSDAGNETPGRSGQFAPIPSLLTMAGEHVIAMRISNFHTFSGSIDKPLYLGYFSNIHRMQSRSSALDLFLAGVFFFTALFHFALLFGYRDRWPYGIFGVFCFSCSVFILIQSLLKYFQIDLSQYYALASINDIPWFFMMSLLPIFFLFEFYFPRRIIISVIIGAIAAAITFLPRLAIVGAAPLSWLNPLISANQIHVYATIIFAAGICAWALIQRRAGSLIALIGLIAFLAGVIITYTRELEFGWAVGFAVLIIFLTISLSRQMSFRAKQFRDTELKSARLELELLKKHIQPHFLLNSLNSIIAWLEEDPKTALILVNSLSSEFRMLLDFAREKTIPIADEIKLCVTHLQVMGLRHDRAYRLETRGTCETDRIPPLILHTLVENGLTHGYAGKKTGLFVVTCEKESHKRSIIVFNDSSISADTKTPAEGTGTRYIKKRLEETYPGHWSLSSGPVPEGWEVRIEIKDGPA